MNKQETPTKLEHIEIKDEEFLRQLLYNIQSKQQDQDNTLAFLRAWLSKTVGRVEKLEGKNE